MDGWTDGRIIYIDHNDLGIIGRGRLGVGKMALMRRKYVRRGMVRLRSLVMYIDTPLTGINAMPPGT